MKSTREKRQHLIGNALHKTICSALVISWNCPLPLLMSLGGSPTCVVDDCRNSHTLDRLTGKAGGVPLLNYTVSSTGIIACFDHQRMIVAIIEADRIMQQIETGNFMDHACTGQVISRDEA